MPPPVRTGTVDVATYNSGNFSSGSGLTYALAADAEILVVDFVLAYPGNEAGIAATWNGAAMALISSSVVDSSNTRGVAYKFAIKTGDAGFTTGTHDIAITSGGNFGGGGNASVIATGYKTINQASPWGTPITSSGTGDASNVVTDATTNDLILDVLSLQRGSSASSIAKTGGTRTDLVAVDGSGSVQSECRVEEGAGTGANFTCSWTISLADAKGWNAISVTLKGSSGGGGGGGTAPHRTFTETQAARSIEEANAQSFVFAVRLFRPRQGIAQATQIRPQTFATRILDDPLASWDIENTVRLFSPSPGFATPPTPRVISSTAAAIAAQEDLQAAFTFPTRIFRPAAGAQPSSFVTPRKTFSFSSAVIDGDDAIAQFISVFGARLFAGKPGSGVGSPHRTISSNIEHLEQFTAQINASIWYGARLVRARQAATPSIVVAGPLIPLELAAIIREWGLRVIISPFEASG